jgi:hypothetical protein
MSDLIKEGKTKSTGSLSTSKTEDRSSQVIELGSSAQEWNRIQLGDKFYSEVPKSETEFRLREKALNFLMIAFGGLLIATISIFLFQGFKLWGFFLPESLLHWLGGATISQIASLLMTAYGYIFKRDPFFIVRELVRLYEKRVINAQDFKELINDTYKHLVTLESKAKDKGK